MKYCVNCGSEINEATKFCGKCGAEQPRETVVEPASMPTQVQTEWNTEVGATTVPGQAEQATQAADHGFQEQLGLIGSVKYVIDHALKFNPNPAESRKSVFWWGYLGIAILQCFVIFIPILGLILNVILGLALVSAAIRRFNYLGKAPWLGWLLLVPFANLYVYIMMMIDKPKTTQI